LRKADTVRVGCAVGGGIFGVFVGAVPLTPLKSVWGLPAGFGVAAIIRRPPRRDSHRLGDRRGASVPLSGAGPERDLPARDRAARYVRRGRGGRNRHGPPRILGMRGRREPQHYPPRQL